MIYKILLPLVLVFFSFYVKCQIVVFDTFKQFQKEILNVENDTQTVVINFWATWCKPCVEELPYFESLNQKYKNKGVKLILVSLDSKKDHAKLVDFVEKRGLKTEIIHLADNKYNSWIDKVSKDWSGSIPATLVRKGNESNFYEQQFDTFVELEAILKPFNH